MSVGIVVFFFIHAVRNRQPDFAAYVSCFAGYIYIYILFAFSRGKIGLGDATISALIASAVGLELWIWTLLLASLFGLAYGSVSIAVRYETSDGKIPFAPFLSLGCYITLLLKNSTVLLP